MEGTFCVGVKMTACVNNKSGTHGLRLWNLCWFASLGIMKENWLKWSFDSENIGCSASAC